jgi:molybdopterin-guanine dinucleotide biosynthesis protein A
VHGLILAGGEGSRLAADGVRDAKAAVPLGGRAQIVRLVDTLYHLGCETVTCMVRDDRPQVLAALRVAAAGEGWTDLRVTTCHTPSSLHTLVEGLDRAPAGAVFCTMVDTVMRRADWRAVYADAARALAEGADAVLAVTPYVDDERPLWVARDAAGFVGRLGGRPATSAACVTGGVYAFSSRAREAALLAHQDGLARMRDFLGELVDLGARVATTEVARIVDVDHHRDLEAAEALVLADVE